jgi:hypothetical protein
VIASLVLLLTLALPGGKLGSTVYDPAADAQAAYRSLQEQIGPSETSPAVDGAISDSPHGSAEVAGRRLKRNLFAPAETMSHSTPKVLRRSTAGPRLPTLSGVLIDGDLRKAVVAGKVVSTGDSINGFLVLEIDTDGVLLERNNLQHRILIRGTP